MAARRIDTSEDLIEGLEALVKADPRLARVATIAGPLPLRRSQPDFASLASIIISQQVSRASAAAMFGRLSRLVDPLHPEALAAAGEPVLREAGLSRPKQRTLLAICREINENGLDLAALCDHDPAQAMARLTAIPGVGPWTAEVYLLFAAGHPDILPARDVALQSAVGHAFGIEPRPGEKALAALAESWAPWRGVAARLFWAYYAETRGRDGAPPLGRHSNPEKA